jgi:hypothetical protein
MPHGTKRIASAGNGLVVLICSHEFRVDVRGTTISLSPRCRSVLSFSCSTHHPIYAAGMAHSAGWGQIETNG